MDPKLNISKGFAYVEYESADDASRGQQFMDGGQIDGNKIRVTFVLVTSNRGPSGILIVRSEANYSKRHNTLQMLA